MRVKHVVVVIALMAGGFLWVAPASAALPPVTRVSGADRFATAAAASAGAFSPGVDVAYLAVGTNFPDALAAGPAGAKLGGPVLLVNSTAVPGPTAGELDRLNPDKIVILGGTEAVSDSVAASVQQYTAGAVTRIAGTDRYDTSAKLSAGTFTPGVPVAYVATGLNFPDAVAGAAAAGSQGGPVLLVSTNAVPTPVANELDRLNPSSIVVLGGTGAISAAVETQLGAFSGSVVRRFGADRYLTAVAVSAGAFAAGSDRVFIATGQNFPDALAGAPIAGIADSPMLLVPGTCIPPQVNAEIARLTPDAATILGGEGAVSAAVAAGQVCAPPPVAPVTFGDGTYQVNSQIPAGTYRTRADADSCYWERLESFSGDFDAIIANEFTDFHTVVTIKSTDVGFTTEDCGTWTNDLSAITSSPTAPFGQGTWIVNTDIAPGTWTAPGGSSCYWERVASFGGEIGSIIANDFDTINPIVAIGGADAGFDTSNCGTWTKIG